MNRGAQHVLTALVLPVVKSERGRVEFDEASALTTAKRTCN